MPSMLLLSTLVIAGAVGVAAFTLLTQFDERQVARESLRKLNGTHVDDARHQELMDSFVERALRPLLGGLSGLGRRVTPVGYLDKVRRKFIHMGTADPAALERFLAVRAGTLVGAVVVFIAVIVVNVTPFSGRMQFAVGGLGIAALLLGPDSVINRKVEERQRRIQRSLPDVLDLLTISVEAGLGFEQALDRVIAAVPGPLTEEFSRMLGETRAGTSRADAMRAMDERCNTPELRSFVLAIIQADQFGVSIGRVLRAQAEEMRIKRRQLAQERAQKAPVKMLIPMVFCIFPALFLVILGPAMISISQGF